MVDSGAKMHMVREKDFNSAELENGPMVLPRTRSLQQNSTQNGPELQVDHGRDKWSLLPRCAQNTTRSVHHEHYSLLTSTDHMCACGSRLKAQAQGREGLSRSVSSLRA